MHLLAVVPASSLDLEYMEGLGGTWIYASGTIVAGDHDALFEWSHDDEIEGVLLDSPGGSVAEAIEIGELIRSFGLMTMVRPGGRCYSACFLAFIGGENRIVPDDARLGVHQFSGTAANETADDAQAIAQSLAAEMFTHVQTMGLDLAVLLPALRTPADGMHVFGRSELEKLGIDRFALLADTPATDTCTFPTSYEDISDPLGLLPECAHRPGYRGP